MHIGLIGGIGVAATLVYYQRLVAAIHALDGRPEITIVHAQAQELLRNNIADRREAQAEIYASLVDRLKAVADIFVTKKHFHMHPCRWCPPSRHWMSTSHRRDWVR